MKSDSDHISQSLITEDENLIARQDVNWEHDELRPHKLFELAMFFGLAIVSRLDW